jgi:hypothetical protein
VRIRSARDPIIRESAFLDRGVRARRAIEIPISHRRVECPAALGAQPISRAFLPSKYDLPPTARGDAGHGSSNGENHSRSRNRTVKGAVPASLKSPAAQGRCSLRQTGEQSVPVVLLANISLATSPGTGIETIGMKTSFQPVDYSVAGVASCFSKNGSRSVW